MFSLLLLGSIRQSPSDKVNGSVLLFIYACICILLLILLIFSCLTMVWSIFCLYFLALTCISLLLIGMVIFSCTVVIMYFVRYGVIE